jgi:acyl-CoA thioester hydrolase
MTAGSGSLAGSVRDGRHVLALRVYYEDTDAGGMVYYANYLKFAERARTEMLRLAGFDHGAIADRFGLAFVVRDCALSYKRPAHLDDLLEVRSRFLEVGGASLTAEQLICRETTELARLDVRLACMTGGGRPSRIPEALRDALAAYRDPTDNDADKDADKDNDSTDMRD